MLILAKMLRLLTGVDIAVLSHQLPSLPQGEYYWRDPDWLCGVVTTQGYQLGSVSECMETGSNDVLVVTGQFK